MFEINSETGAITVVSPIDRESVSKVVLMVTAEDLNGLTEQIAQCKFPSFVVSAKMLFVMFDQCNEQ